MGTSLAKQLLIEDDIEEVDALVDTHAQFNHDPDREKPDIKFNKCRYRPKENIRMLIIPKYQHHRVDSK